MAEKNACSSSKRDSSKGTHISPPTVRASKEQGFASMHTAIPTKKTKTTKSKSSCAQRKKPNLLKDDVLPALYWAHIYGTQGKAIATNELIHGAETKVFSPASISESTFAAEKSDSALPHTTVILEQESVRQASCSYEMTPQKQEEVDAGDHQQLECKRTRLSTRQKRMHLEKDLPETSKQDQIIVSVEKNMASTGFNERRQLIESMQKLVPFHDGTEKATQTELVVEMEQSNNFATAYNYIKGNNIERPFELLQTSSRPAARYQLNYPTIPPSPGFQSMIEARAKYNSYNSFMNSNSPDYYINHAGTCSCVHRTTDLNNPCYGSDHFHGLGVAEQRFESPPSMQLNHDPRLSYMSHDPSIYSSPGFPYDAQRPPVQYVGQYAGTGQIPPASTDTRFWSALSAHTSSSLTGTSSPNIACSDSTPYDYKLQDHGLSISSTSHSLSSGSKSSPSPYSSLGYPYDAEPTINRIGQYAGAGLITPPSSSIWSSSFARTSSLGRSVPFQLEDNLHIMGGDVRKNQSPLHRRACSDSIPHDHDKKRAILEASIRGSPPQQLQYSGSTRFPDARSHQYVANEVMSADDRLLQRGYSPSYFTDSSFTTSTMSKMRLLSLSNIVEGSRREARSELAKSKYAGEVHVNAAERGTASELEPDEPPIEFSLEEIKAMLPADLDFLYKTSPESTSSSAKQYEVSSPMNVVVTVSKPPAILPARSSSSFPKHAVDAPPFIPAKRSFSSTEAKTAESPAKGSPFFCKAVARPAPHTPGKSNSPPCTGSSSSPNKTAGAVPHIPAAKSFPTHAAQSPETSSQSPSSPTISPARASPCTPVEGPSKESQSPNTLMVTPARRPPLYPKKATTPISTAIHLPSRENPN